MVEQIDTFLYRFRFILFGIVALCGVLALSMLFVGNQATAACLQASSTSTASVASGGPDDANMVAAGLISAADSLSQSLNAIGHRADCNAKSLAASFSGSTHLITTGLASFGTFISHGSIAVLHGIGHGLHSSGAFIVGSAVNSARFIASIMGGLAGLVTHTPLVGSVIRPSAHAPVPVIDAGAPLPLYVASALPTAKIVSETTPQPAAAAAVQWPIHGAITTAFGVPEPPYQPIHTGLDISDGWRSGATPIHPFKPGRVIDVIHSSGGLGNHIIVDHGHGLTSVYGHLYSTTVQVGQQVDLGTVLGYEGSTGASTGTHLHFEIRVNGQPNDPHKFIPGQP